jgi:hypothetical protein
MGMLQSNQCSRSVDPAFFLIETDSINFVGLWQLAWLKVEGAEEKEDASSEA